MRWQKRWPRRAPRPQVQPLEDAQRAAIVRRLEKGIAASPVLSAFGIKVRAARGRFYLERHRRTADAEPSKEYWGRITPLADEEKQLLLEVERSSNTWREVARGSAAQLIAIVAGDTRGTFHAMGCLDASLRKLEQGQQRRPMAFSDGWLVYTDSGQRCTVQEALYHYFGLPIEVIAEPARWYTYQRRPQIVEWNDAQTRVLVLFSTESMSGEPINGTCLYAQRDGQWGAYTVKPSNSETIAEAEAWLVKKKWRPW